MNKSRGPKRRRAPVEEEHENLERWMISYADMLTLLFVLFVVLFAISQLDQAKFKALKDSLSMGFGAQSAALTGQQSAMDGQSAAQETFPVDLDPGVGGGHSAGQSAENKQAVSAAIAKATAKRISAQRSAASREIQDFR